MKMRQLDSIGPHVSEIYVALFDSLLMPGHPSTPGCPDLEHPISGRLVTG